MDNQLQKEANMNFDQLAQLNAIEPSTDLAHISVLRCLEDLDNLVHQLSLKNSKPFSIKNEMLIPTKQLYLFNTAVIKGQNTDINGWLRAITEHTKVKNTSIYALNRIQSILSQHQWFDLLSINQHIYKQQIHSYLNTLWNETRGYKSSSEVEHDNKSRDKLIKDQRTENSKIVSRLLKKHSNVQVSRLFFNLNLLGNFSNIELTQTEKIIYGLKAQLISQLQELNQGNLYCIQWRVQRTLTGFYYLNVLIYHILEYRINMPQVQNELIYRFDNAEGQTISMNLDYNNIKTYVIGNNPYCAISFEQWKVFFNQILYPLKYYYYQSKVISPKFNNIIY